MLVAQPALSEGHALHASVEAAWLHGAVGWGEVGWVVDSVVGAVAGEPFSGGDEVVGGLGAVVAAEVAEVAVLENGAAVGSVLAAGCAAGLSAHSTCPALTVTPSSAAGWLVVPSRPLPVVVPSRL